MVGRSNFYQYAESRNFSAALERDIGLNWLPGAAVWCPGVDAAHVHGVPEEEDLLAPGRDVAVPGP